MAGPPKRNLKKRLLSVDTGGDPTGVAGRMGVEDPSAGDCGGGDIVPGDVALGLSMLRLRPSSASSSFCAFAPRRRHPMSRP